MRRVARAHKCQRQTTPATSILPGITRDTVLKLLRQSGVEAVEDRFTRDEVYLAEEAFMTGTAAEVTPVREVDDRKVGAGKPGPITRELQRRYAAVIRGEAPEHLDWLTHVE